MRTIKKQRLSIRRHQNGASLAIVLLFVGVVLAAIASFYKSQNTKTPNNLTEIAAWEGVQIARAARLYVRNEIAGAGINAQETVAIASAISPRITIDNLVANNLLPENFMATRVDALGNYTNTLGQRIEIIQQNFPLGGATNDPATVPTAYVIFHENPDIDDVTEANLMRDIVTTMQRMDLTLYAPIFNGGANISNNCRGEPSIAYWDTNCINNTDYNILTSGADFTQGNLLIPAWRTVNFDTRAIMRFPQPEQAGLNMMLTDLSLGSLNCAANVRINDPTGDGMMGDLNATNPICETNDDDPIAGDDNRRSILRPGFIEADNLILDPQAGVDVYRYDPTNINPVTGEMNPIIKGAEDSDVTIPGNLIIQNGETRIFGMSAATGLQVTSSTTVASNVILPNGSVTQIDTAQADITNASRLNLANSNIDTNAFVNIDEFHANAGLTSNNNLTSEMMNITPGNSFQIDAGNLSVHTFSGLINNVNVNGTNTIQGSGYSFATRQLSANSITANDTLTTNDIKLQNPSNSAVSIDASNDAGTASCKGSGCPRRSAQAFCSNYASKGYTTKIDCLNSYNP